MKIPRFPIAGFLRAAANAIATGLEFERQILRLQLAAGGTEEIWRKRRDASGLSLEALMGLALVGCEWEGTKLVSWPKEWTDIEQEATVAYYTIMEAKRDEKVAG